ncbi:PQQ-binding-like beta-propeller repeat protein [Haloarcula sp. S1CR25-12]|uniref:PQQ-binding-like beta-propeller repeat protein n=1 Tax=Haloarcula saliterrae TaxID=2950534 RepID=A0ABU2F9G7_9EURY|nr:PQQ-binding-like beta-propeller repeat protein [Haloarcula sp. S1CR25-12]MDS0258866.1 PQQ-binding-like beta-propeller repeat protein [Haloarcula sp. S1CR25-12]
MRTRRAFLAAAATAAVAGCQGERDGEPSGTATEQGTATATGTDRPSTGDTPEHVAWRQSVPGVVTFPPTVDGDRLFVGTEMGTVASLSSAAGDLDWTRTPDERIAGSPVAGNGTVLAIGRADEPFGTETLYAFEAASGTPRWEFPSTNWWLDVVGIDGDTAYVATNDDALGPTGETLYALALSDGTQRWSAEIGDPSESLRTAERLFVRAPAAVYAIDRDGRRAWRYRPESYELRSLSAVGDALAFVTVDASGRDVVRGLDAATGGVSWTVGELDPTTTAAVDGQLLVGGESVASLDPATGEPQWDADVSAPLNDPPHADGTVYVAGDEVAAVSLADGTVEWRTAVDVSLEEASDGTEITASPAGLLGDRLLLRRSVGEDDRRYQALALDAASGDPAWTVDGESDLTQFAVADAVASAGDGERVVAFDP